jgi:hypothetical protein
MAGIVPRTSQPFAPGENFNQAAQLIEEIERKAEEIEFRLRKLELAEDGGSMVGSTASPKALAHVNGTQDTDTWIRATDRKAVTLYAITDIYWDSPSIKARLRPMKFDSLGMLYEVGGEDVAITIATAETC